MAMKMDIDMSLSPIMVIDPESEMTDNPKLLIELGEEVNLLEPEQHDKLLEYLLDKMRQGNQKRIDRIQRFARIDQMISTWQKLSPEDTVRQVREDSTGRHQALPINLPLIQAHIEDAVAFFTEVFAPVGGSFFATPGSKQQTTQVKLLTSKMEQDMKQSAYYSGITSTMNAITKYNVGGAIIKWVKKSRLNESDGNVYIPIDVYNFLYDPSIVDVTKLHTDGEWCASIEIRNRLWLIREAEKDGLQNLENVLSGKSVAGDKLNSYEPGKAKFYKNPPRQTNITDDGQEGQSVRGEVDDHGVDWAGYGLGLGQDAAVTIEGYEVVTMYAWINPDQFDLEKEEGNESLLELWQFKIVDAQWIIEARKHEQQVELPAYMTRLRKDEMNEAMRSLAESIRPFQRFISFLLNTHVESIRKDIWGLLVYDPTMVDIEGLKAGETSGRLPLKKSGDARAALQKPDLSSNTTQNVQTAGEMMNLMKLLFPNQAAPSQIAGMDRAVTSQVSAVLQGAMRRMHMLVRAMDSSMMLPIRMAMYRNIANLDPDKAELGGITPEQVAELLSGGFGQINREAAAEQLRGLIFAIIQNPEGNEAYDVPALLQLWSMLMNIGTDLSEFYRQPAQTTPQPGAEGAPVPVDPAAAGIAGA